MPVPESPQHPEDGRRQSGVNVSRRDFLVGAAGGGAALSTAVLLDACGSSTPQGTTQGSSGRAVHGGTLRVGVGGGGPADRMDPQYTTDFPSGIYWCALYDQLTLVNEQMQLEDRLAQEVHANAAATQWTVRLKQDLEFHNGKTVTADDVIYSFNRIMNPKDITFLGWLTNFVASMDKLDPLTVRFNLKQPMGWFDLAIGTVMSTGIIPVDFNIKKPVGTGPFKFVSYSPGQQAVFERFANYWGGPAYLDKLVVMTINDDEARLNALLTKQIDLVVGILPSQVPQVKSTSDLTLYNSPSSSFTPITMRVDKAPLDDVRVRQALRLCIDRQQVLEQAASGYGRAGDDLYSPYDPDYDRSLVRTQDLDQAKSLLKQAGRSDLSLELVTCNLAPGLIPQCEVVAQNASQIGAKISLREVDPATLLGPDYLSWPFAVDLWPGMSYLATSVLADGPSATVNETHFKLPRYENLWKQASATPDADRRKTILAEMQTILFDQGGYIIPAYMNQLSACTTNVGGYPSRDLRGMGPVATSMSQLHFAA